MIDILTAKQAAVKWGISPRRVLDFIYDGKIEGAFKVGNTWLIPADAQKPPDPRIARKERGEPYHINAKNKAKGGEDK